MEKGLEDHPVQEKYLKNATQIIEQLSSDKGTAVSAFPGLKYIKARLAALTFICYITDEYSLVICFLKGSIKI